MLNGTPVTGLAATPTGDLVVATGAGDLETHLVLTDGTRTWDNADLAAVTAADASDPTWLRIQAAVNNIRG
ncbi:hypothetical protein ACQEWB_05460 [Streptomyces sp. CA-249302]|uniref:hypothetical protein n=1 Tax=Streptomyces sp. CA-249302 TaxID=3240058 RepID=UPI003D94AB88